MVEKEAQEEDDFRVVAIHFLNLSPPTGEKTGF